MYLGHWGLALERNYGSHRFSVSLCFIASGVMAHCDMSSCHCHLIIHRVQISPLACLILEVEHPALWVEISLDFLSSLSPVFYYSNSEETDIWRWPLTVICREIFWARGGIHLCYMSHSPLSKTYSLCLAEKQSLFTYFCDVLEPPLSFQAPPITPVGSAWWPAFSRTFQLGFREFSYF
jgi:hypothetical protein